VYRITILLALSSAMLLGCSDKTTNVKPGTFRVDVKNDPSNGEDFCETVVSFHPPSGSEITVRTANSESMVSFDSKNPNSDQPTFVRLSADRMKSSDGAKSEFTTLIRPQTPNGAYSGGPSTNIVDGAMSASEFLAITVDNGDFPLNKPIELGTLNGEPITMTVRTR